MVRVRLHRVHHRRALARDRWMAGRVDNDDRPGDGRVEHGRIHTTHQPDHRGHRALRCQHPNRIQVAEATPTKSSCPHWHTLDGPTTTASTAKSATSHQPSSKPTTTITTHRNIRSQHQPGPDAKDRPIQTLMTPNDMIDVFGRQGASRCIEIGRLIQCHLEADLNEATSAKLVEPDRFPMFRLTRSQVRNVDTSIVGRASSEELMPEATLYERLGSRPSGAENFSVEFDEVAAKLVRTLDVSKVPQSERDEVLSAFAAHNDEVTEAIGLGKLTVDRVAGHAARSPRDRCVLATAQRRRRRRRVSATVAGRGIIWVIEQHTPCQPCTDHPPSSSAELEIHEPKRDE